MANRVLARPLAHREKNLDDRSHELAWGGHKGGTGGLVRAEEKSVTSDDI